MVAFIGGLGFGFDYDIFMGSFRQSMILTLAFIGSLRHGLSVKPTMIDFVHR